MLRGWRYLGRVAGVFMYQQNRRYVGMITRPMMPPIKPADGYYGPIDLYGFIDPFSLTGDSDLYYGPFDIYANFNRIGYNDGYEAPVDLIADFSPSGYNDGYEAPIDLYAYMPDTQEYTTYFGPDDMFAIFPFVNVVTSDSYYAPVKFYSDFTSLNVAAGGYYAADDIYADFDFVDLKQPSDIVMSDFPIVDVIYEVGGTLE